MTSPKQLEANRTNAKHSPGPKSTNGKARSSRNALKHGLVSSEIVIWDEDADQFELLRAGLGADFQPNSTSRISRSPCRTNVATSSRAGARSRLNRARSGVGELQRAMLSQFTLQKDNGKPL